MSHEFNGFNPESEQLALIESSHSRSHKSIQNVIDLADGLACGVDEGDITPYPFAYHKSDNPGLDEPKAREMWERKWEMFGLIAGTESSAEMVGKGLIPAITRQRVGQVLNELCDEIYEVLPEDKLCIPRDSLSFNKSSTEAGRRRRSLGQGGHLGELLNLVSKGELNKESLDSLGGTRSSFKHYRKFGIEIPYAHEMMTPRQQAAIDRLKKGELDEEAIRELFNDIDANNSVSVSLSLSQAGVVSPLLTYLKERGADVNKRTLCHAYDQLKKLGALITRTHKTAHNRPKTYYHILTDHEPTKQACKTFIEKACSPDFTIIS